ncbi:MAG: type IV pilus twitching motility protein PilT [Clostridiales bacterium]|nr:type IV pilus twitching motility protein PilT [Clostridiales bacterium]
MYTMDQLLREAKKYNASDLHLTVGTPPKFRINGSLVDVYQEILKPIDVEFLVSSLMNERTTAMLEEKGEVDFSYSIVNEGRYRVNVFKQRNSYAAVIRLITMNIPKPDDLGLPSSIVELTKKRRGLVLVTGPTGSGKSTSLASLVDRINELYPYHIITIEDPIEYLHNHKRAIVNQRELGQDTMTYANALRAALREDPDVILVGEMRDLETISTAVSAAETGHLVFSTLHTIGSAETIDRIIDVFPPHQQQQIRTQLASVLEAVISQQLIPTADDKGRVAAFEIMLNTPAIKNHIRESKTHMIASVLQTNRKQGMITMDDALFDLWKEKKIKKESAINFAQDPISLSKRFLG